MDRPPQGPPLDRLAVHGIRATGYHGVFEHERRQGQEFVVDVTLGVDTRPAGAEDELAKTVDYGRLTLQIRKAIESDPVNLIETLANRVAERCLGDPLVQWVEVTVHKPHAPIGVPFDDVTLTILRSRQ
jgi:dihydroneopterin aldolase